MSARDKIKAASNGKRPAQRGAGRQLAQHDLQVHAVRQQLKGIIEMAIAALALVDLLAGTTPNALLPTGPQRPAVLMGRRDT